MWRRKKYHWSENIEENWRKWKRRSRKLNGQRKWLMAKKVSMKWKYYSAPKRSWKANINVAWKKIMSISAKCNAKISKKKQSKWKRNRKLFRVAAISKAVKMTASLKITWKSESCGYIEMAFWPAEESEAMSVCESWESNVAEMQRESQKMAAESLSGNTERKKMPGVTNRKWKTRKRQRK